RSQKPTSRAVGYTRTATGVEGRSDAIEEHCIAGDHSGYRRTLDAGGNPFMGSRLGRRMVLATKVSVWLVLAFALVTALTRLIVALRDEPRASAGSTKPFPGYTLVAPVLSTKTHLIDMQGRVVHTWESRYTAGQAAYLLEDGHLLRAGQLPRDERLFGGPQA